MGLNSQSPSLQVLFAETRVGSLSFNTKDSKFLFTYDPIWTKQKNFAISPHILPETPVKSESVQNFFENLLPEGKALRDLVQILKVPQSNIFALVAAIGRETTGALTLTLSEELPQNVFRKILVPELQERIKDRKKKPIAIWDAKPRISVAGVQDKLPVVLRDNEYGLGEGAIASTHILKFGQDQAPHLVVNEAFCLDLAAKIGLPVAAHEIIHFSEPVLQVTRFDREWANRERVQRHHIIDGCQALDLAPAYKYERFLGDEPHVADIHGQANLKNLYEFCKKCEVPAKAQLQLLQWVFFNLIIGNCDHHIKNISYFIDNRGIRLAPAYDLVNVTMYPNFHQSLAFKIGDTFELNEINTANLEIMADELNLKKTFVEKQLQLTANSVVNRLELINLSDWISKKHPFTPSDEQRDFIEELKANIKGRAQQFLAL